MSETGNLCPLRNSASASCTFLLAHTAAPISVLSSLLQYPSQRAVQKVQSRPCKARTRLDRLAGTTRCVLCCELRRRAAASQKLTAAQPQGPLLPALLRRHKPVASRARGFSPSPQLAALGSPWRRQDGLQSDPDCQAILQGLSCKELSSSPGPPPWHAPVTPSCHSRLHPLCRSQSCPREASSGVHRGQPGSGPCPGPSSSLLDQPLMDTSPTSPRSLPSEQ